MTEPVPRAPGAWQIATVAAIRVETPTVKTFVLEPPMWMPHLPGQHYDVRLTAPDGEPATAAARQLAISRTTLLRYLGKSGEDET